MACGGRCPADTIKQATRNKLRPTPFSANRSSKHNANPAVNLGFDEAQWSRFQPVRLLFCQYIPVQSIVVIGSVM